jgi:CHAD domain-containing protein
VSPAISPAPALTVREAAARIVARQVRELLRAGEAATGADDPVAVHQMRVHLRRVRAALALFAAVVRPPRRARPARLRRLSRALGRVRDLDVALALLAARHLPHLEGEEAARAESLVAALEERRRRARRRLAARLDGGRHRELRAALKRAARRPHFTEHEDGDAMAARYLTDAIRRAADRVSARRAMTERAPSVEDLHALRVAVKRLRYLLDFHAETCGIAFDAERRLARQLQDCLGDLHDHDVLAGWLAEDGGRGGRGGRGGTAARGHGKAPRAPVEASPPAGAWRVLSERVAADRAALLRRFVRLRRQWRARTEPGGVVAPLEEPRFVNLEPAPVQLRIATAQKTVASLRLVR